MKKKLIMLTLALVTTAATFAQVGIGTKTPHPSAFLELSSTTKGFLPPRVTTAQRDAITSPAAGLLVYNTSNGCLESWNNATWVSLCDALQPPTVTSGACAGQPVEFIHNGKVYKPVAYLGRCWLDRNLGATRLPTAVDDLAASGDVYQWGRATDGHEKISALTYKDGKPSTPTQSGPWDGLFIARAEASSGGIEDWLDPSIENRWQGVNGVNNPCPAGYRLPVETELQSVQTSFQPDVRQAAFNSPLKMTDTYSRSIQGQIFTLNLTGSYWSSTAYYASYNNALDGFEEGYIPVNFSFNSSSSSISGLNAIQSSSVRCIKD